MKNTLIGIVLAGILALSGCEKGIESGRVYNKEQYSHRHVMRAKPLHMSARHTHYRIHIESEVNGERKTNYFNVDERTYNWKQVGDTYP